MSIAAFVIIYRRRMSGVDTTVAEELMEWKAKHGSHGSHPGSTTGSLANPMYGAVAQTEAKAFGAPSMYYCVRIYFMRSYSVTDPNRVSLKGLNVHAWLQEVKGKWAGMQVMCGGVINMWLCRGREGEASVREAS